MREGRHLGRAIDRGLSGAGPRQFDIGIEGTTIADCEIWAEGRRR
ncbi:hypothetical protein [Methylorubrum populi]|nr:hypothetical protein [Methylorubrum populi]